MASQISVERGRSAQMFQIHDCPQFVLVRNVSGGNCVCANGDGGCGRRPQIIFYDVLDRFEDVVLVDQRILDGWMISQSAREGSLNLKDSVVVSLESKESEEDG